MIDKKMTFNRAWVDSVKKEKEDRRPIQGGQHER